MVHNRVGPPVRNEDFYGRDALVAFIWERLQSGQHILLAAPRRFGKTSVMYRLRDRPVGNYKVIQVDLEALVEPAEFIASLVAGMLALRDDTLTRIAQGLSYFPRRFW